jgi:hypothetical protein
VIRSVVLLYDVLAPYLIRRSDGPRPLSFHAEPSNSDPYLDQQLQEDAQQTVLPFDGVQTLCRGSIGRRALLDVAFEAALLLLDSPCLSQQKAGS